MSVSFAALVCAGGLIVLSGCQPREGQPVSAGPDVKPEERVDGASPQTADDAGEPDQRAQEREAEDRVKQFTQLCLDTDAERDQIRSAALALGFEPFETHQAQNIPWGILGHAFEAWKLERAGPEEWVVISEAGGNITQASYDKFRTHGEIAFREPIDADVPIRPYFMSSPQDPDLIGAKFCSVFFNATDHAAIAEQLRRTDYGGTRLGTPFVSHARNGEGRQKGLSAMTITWRLNHRTIGYSYADRGVFGGYNQELTFSKAVTSGDEPR